MLRKMGGMVLLLLLCCPALSFAAPDTPYVISTVIGYNHATPQVQSITDLLYAAAMEHRERVELPRGTRYDDVTAAMSLIYREYPELFHLSEQYTTSYYRSDPSYATAVTLAYRMDKQDADNLRASALKQAGWIAAQASGTNLEKLLYIHDTLCERITYEETGLLSHTVAGALLNGYAVCDGYAAAMNLTARLCGIPCGMVTGQAYTDMVPGDHAWNVAEVNGGFCYIDVTWDDEEEIGRPMHWYFGLSLDQISADHTADESGLDYLPSDDRSEYHRNFALIGHSGWQEEAMTALEQFVTRGTPLEIRFDNPVEDADFSRTLTSLLDRYNTAYPLSPFYDAYYMVCCKGQSCWYVGRNP